MGLSLEIFDRKRTKYYHLRIIVRETLPSMSKEYRDNLKADARPNFDREIFLTVMNGIYFVEVSLRIPISTAEMRTRPAPPTER